MNKIKLLLLYLISFLLMYRPFDIFGINSNIFFALVFIIFVFIDMVFRGKFILNVFKIKYVFNFIITILFCCVYCLIIVLINNTSNINFVDLRIAQHLMIIIYFSITCFIINYLKKSGYSKENMIEFILNISFMQGIICVLMILFPSFRQIAINSFANITHFNLGDYIFNTRIYGLADSYTYGLPIVNGILSGLCFYHCLYNNKKYFYKLPFIFLVSILNGRTGMLVGLISIFIVVVFSSSRKKVKSLLLSALVLSLFVVFVNLLKNYNNSMYAFISHIFSLSNDSTVTYLMRKALFFPSGFSILFGSGIRVYGSIGISLIGRSSDIGFVNYIFLGGLIYLFTFLGGFFKFIYSSFKNENKFGICKYILILVAIIACMKGEIFNNMNFIFCLFFICNLFFLSNNDIEKDYDC